MQSMQKITNINLSYFCYFFNCFETDAVGKLCYNTNITEPKPSMRQARRGGSFYMKKWIDADFGAHLSLLKTLAAIPAPSHHEEQRAAFIKNWLEEAGAEKVYIDAAQNVILPFLRDDSDAITVYMAHTDVVFPDLTPLPVTQDGNILRAPGVGDDTANVAAILTCARYILEQGLRPRESVLLVLNSCEEGLGNLKGVRQIVSDFSPHIRELISFDCTLDEGLICRAVGSERWRISAATAGGHSYGDFGRPNAVHRMAQLVSRLYQQQLPAWPDQHTTYNVGVISGGTSVNTIAQDAQILYEYRSDDARALDFMRKQFFRIMEEVKDQDVSWSRELLGERPCGGAVDTAAWEKLLQRCAAAIENVTGVRPGRRSGSTDANIPLSQGIPAVTFGLYRGGGAHTREEWLDIDSLKPGLELCFELVTSHFV